MPREDQIVKKVLDELEKQAQNEDNWYWYRLEQRVKQLDPEIEGVPTLYEIARAIAKERGLL